MSYSKNLMCSVDLAIQLISEIHIDTTDVSKCFAYYRDIFQIDYDKLVPVFAMTWR